MPRPPGAPASPRLPAGARDELRRRRRRALPAGVVRDANPPDPLARELRAAGRRPAVAERTPGYLRFSCRPRLRRVGTGWARRAGRASCSAPARASTAGRSSTSTKPRKPLTVYVGVARPRRGRTRPSEARPGELRAGEAGAGPVLERAAGPGSGDGRSREARARRGAEPPDPEPLACLAVQPRQLVRAVLVGSWSTSPR